MLEQRVTAPGCRQFGIVRSLMTNTGSKMSTGRSVKKKICVNQFGPEWQRVQEFLGWLQEHSNAEALIVK